MIGFVVVRVPPSPEKPQGSDYSLTLHDPDDEPLVGFDNTHPVEEARRAAGPSPSRG